MSDKRLTFLQLAHAQLELRVKQQLTGELIAKEVSEFREKITPQIKDLVESITFENIDTFRDMCTLRDEIEIHIKWSKEKNNGE